MSGRLAEFITLLQSQSRDPGVREDCFRNIWKEYYPKLLVFVRGFGAGEPEDLVQEIMEKVYKGIGSYDRRFGFSTWVYAIARNHCLDSVRRRGRAAKSIVMSDLPDPTEPAHDVTPELELIRREEDRRVRGFMAAADPDTRQLAFLRYHQGLGCREISGIMGIPVGTVKFRLHRLREEVRAHLEADG
jgi:RNA polymerase sigma factor (sigma-70 family)